MSFIILFRNYESTITKWKKAINPDAPLKDYAKKVLADRK